ncbi:uncharacterized protein LOC120154112 [Hibiscus syriacus]|uniref:uncharacterized protein LOC120154112 n=1 Tax=Hibiscus syriacus TaxID=106335 RepID=UPI001923B054|nr:uncharacterized protein LOC120154112 [Hibiscus syriacus]
MCFSPYDLLGSSARAQKEFEVSLASSDGKIQSRLQSWKSKVLSFGGRLTLIRSMLSNLPVYFISLFPIPKGVVDFIDKVIASFVLKGNSERGIHWLNWKSVCGLKSHGGLGIFDALTRNRAMLNKWVWHFSEENDSLWKKIIVAKYNYDPLDILPKEVYSRNSSWVWRNIVNPMPSHVGNIDLRKGHFDWEIPLWSHFLEVINLAASSAHAHDKLKWVGSADRRYTPKFYYHSVTSEGKLVDPIWQVVWCKLVPLKVSGFVWKAVHQRLPVIPELVKWGVHVSDQISCSFCNSFPEYINHILWVQLGSWCFVGCSSSSVLVAAAG